MEITLIYLFVIGCCMGSIVNVVSYRLPLNQSIVYPNSICPKCNSRIKWFDNIPIISWLLLRGNCRACKNKIAFSYPIIELFTGLLFCLNLYAQPAIYSQQSTYVTIFLGSIFSAILLTLAVLDFKYFWLPRILTLGGLFVGITASLYVDLINDFYQFNYLIHTLLASAFGFALFYLLSLVGKKIFNKPVIGGGDSKLSALIGSWIGIQGLFKSLSKTTKLLLFVFINVIFGYIKI